MEPPAKRLRILQSVDVDETNPDYVNAKQKQQQKFKGRLESIFAKYESMHESMSDEIDMRENKVVVDRGHLRRLVRQVNRKETVLLDNLGLEAGREELDDEPENGEETEESEDELAPTQVPKSNSGRKVREQQHGSAEWQVTTSSPLNSRQPGIQAPNPPASGLVQPAIPNVPNTPNPAANLLQFVQFPQTPAGQQAQTCFYATLAQTINQAVQQAVAPLFSSILPNTPNSQLPLTNQSAIPTTPAVSTDKIAPATDPKWFFPPLSAETRKTEVARSSPLQVSASIALPETHSVPATVGAPVGITVTEKDFQEPTFSAMAVIQAEQQVNTLAAKATRRTSPRVEIQHKRKGPSPKYLFTEEEETHISKQKVLEKRTWLEIRNSKEKWRSWPVSAFQQRWYSHIKGKNLHLRGVSIVQTTQGNSHAPEDGTATSLSHHLPTPSSLGHEDSPRQAEHVMSSSTHFDDDELELLSLAGADLGEEQLLVGDEEEETYFPDTNEIILPSVELNDFVNEDILQQGLLEGSPMEEFTKVVNQNTTADVKTETVLLSPSSKRKQQLVPVEHQAVPDSEAEDSIEQVGSSPSPQPNSSFACGICGTTFKNAKNLQRHQDNPRSAHDKLRSRSASIDLVGDDELQASASATPHIKREFSTPPPTSFLFTTPATQFRLRPDLGSSGAKSTSKLDRKAYLKQVKQSWTTKKAMPAPKTVHKRQSLQTVLRKRAWSNDSDDELGM